MELPTSQYPNLKNNNKRNRKKRHKLRIKQQVQLSQAYQESEREIACLLRKRTELGDELNNDNAKNNNDGFYGTVHISNHSPLTENNEASDNKYENNVMESEPLNKTASSMYNTVDSSIIYMEEDQEKTAVHVEYSGIYISNKDYIYRPTANTNYMCELLCYKNTENHWLMFKRLKMEALANKSNLKLDVVNYFKNPPDNQKNYFKHDLNYFKHHSTYEYNFTPIFIKPSVAPVFIPCRKMITLCLKDLRFTKHKYLTDEHELVNKLEILYELYNQRLIENTAEYLYANLETERNILNDLLNSINITNVRDDIIKAQQVLRIQEISSKIKALRLQLYEEEATNKELLNDILDNWLKLKQLRQNTEQQLTRFHLLIKIEKFEAAEMNKQKNLWLKRYNTDLEEIYREQCEEYYCSKRLWQLNHNGLEPKKPNLQKLKKELTKTFARSFYNPEEPRITIKRYLSYERPYSGAKNMTSDILHSYFLRIYLDGHLVGESKCYRLERDLYININEVIGIIINRSLPNKMCIKLYKKYKTSLVKKMANIFVPLPLASCTKYNTSQTLSIKFCSEKMSIAGVIRLDISYNKTIYANNINESIFDRGESPRTRLNEKPYDDDDNIMNCKENYNLSNIDTCTFEEYNLQFCDVEELLNNKRFNLLRSRYLQDNNSTRNLKYIPMLEHELQYSWEETEEIIDVDFLMDPIDIHKHKAKKYLKSLYTALRNHSVQLCRAMTSREDLLVNDYPLSWRSFFHALLAIFQATINVSLSYTCSTNATITTCSIDSLWNINITFHLIRATGIPERHKRSIEYVENRRKKREMCDDNILSVQNMAYTNIKPFIALSYKNKFVRSATAEGSNPTWNEKLTLTVEDTLNDLKDDIKISLFDEVLEQYNNEDDDDSDVHQRIHNNWLGELRIPMNALLKERKFTGVFELQTPSILLGYNSFSLPDDTNIIIEDYTEIKECVYVWCTICIEPSNYELDSINTKYMNCIEVTDLQNHLNAWSLEAEQMCFKHFINPLICTSEGKRICINRLLQPLEPPDNLSNGDQIDEICRFTSLLSTIKFHDPCLDLSGIWLKNEILLDTTWGSRKDIGVLLCNYLLHMGLKCWLILGWALCQGECTFVLYQTKKYTELYLIDPSSGKEYAINDVFCPLQKINMAVNTKQVYLNLQTNLRVSMMSFNFNDTSCWFPVFNNRQQPPVAGFHNITYTYRPCMNITNLRINIERKIIKKINTWRLLKKTKWNRAFQPHLMDILLSLEYAALTNTNTAKENLKYIDYLETEFPNHKLFGFTLNFAYTNLSQITERIKSTRLHLNTNRNVEFSLAVHIHPYVNNVLSVWIFLISIIPPLNDNE